VGTSQQGVRGVKVELYGAGGRRLISTTWTNSGGYYGFRFAAAGEYTVKITPPAGYSASTPSQTVFVRMFEELKLDFLLTQ